MAKITIKIDREVPDIWMDLVSRQGISEIADIILHYAGLNRATLIADMRASKSIEDFESNYKELAKAFSCARDILNAID